MTQTYDIIMLSSSKESPIWLSNGNTLSTAKKEGGGFIIPHPKLGTNQHLYILSDDDQIKNGDWKILNDVFGKPTILIKHDPNKISANFGKKVIASTNSDVTTAHLIDELFIKEYIKAHNNRTPITRVNLELWSSGQGLKITYDKKVIIQRPLKIVEESYGLKYLRNVLNRDNSDNNLFMDGQLECAKHAMDVITELIIKITDLKDNNDISELLTVYKLSDSGTLTVEEVKAKYPNSFNDSKEVALEWLIKKANITIKERSKDYFERLGNVFRDIQRTNYPGMTDEEIYVEIYVKR